MNSIFIFSSKKGHNFNLPLYLVETSRQYQQRSYGLVSMPSRTRRSGCWNSPVHLCQSVSESFSRFVYWCNVYGRTKIFFISYRTLSNKRSWVLIVQTNLDYIILIVLQCCAQKNWKYNWKEVQIYWKVNS